MRSSKLIIKSTAQKVMAKSSFECRFHDLKYFKVGYFFMFLEFTLNLRASLQKFVEKHQFYVILSCFMQIFHNYLSNISTCTLLAPSSKIGRLFLKFILLTNIAWLCESMCFSNVYDFFSFTKFKVSILF